jgi:hypothetical protein
MLHHIHANALTSEVKGWSVNVNPLRSSVLSLAGRHRGPGLLGATQHPHGFQSYIDTAAPSTLSRMQADKTRPGMRGVSLPIAPRMTPRKLMGAATKK